MNKNNGKLLAAVIAMLMVVCAVAVVAMPAEAADETGEYDGLTEYNLESTATPVTAYADGAQVGEKLTLAAAIALINGGENTSNIDTLVFDAGKYDVTKTVNNSTGSASPPTARTAPSSTAVPTTSSSRRPSRSIPP